MKAPLFFLALAWMLLPWTSTAQALRGVVWEMPRSVVRAEDDLVAMQQAGVQAVRTGVIADERLLRLADTLGIQLYQDLPVRRLPAASLLDTLAHVGALVDLVVDRSARHPSARHLGLTFDSDTADPSACAYLQALAARVSQRGVPGMRTYYETPFARHDACAQQVDLVLLDVLDATDPVSRLASWRSSGHEDVVTGIGSLGTGLDAVAGEAGFEAALQRQARYLERSLPPLLADSSGARVVFVMRWRDVVRDVPSPRHNPDAPFLSPYGLHNADDTPRPAFEVLSGIYTGRQTVFALDVSAPQRRSGNWFVIVGWALFFLLGLFYALAPRLRHMVPRYFGAHNFYQDAVREGRDTLLGTSLILLFTLAVGFGMVTWLALDTARAGRTMELVFAWLPPELAAVILAFLGNPWVAITVLGGTYVVCLLTWTFVVNLVARRRYRIMIGQTLMLVVWPRWILLAVVVMAMVASRMDLEAARAWTAYAGCAWLAGSLYALARSLVDVAIVARARAYQVALAALMSPVVVAVALAIALAFRYQAEVTFLVHLLQR